MRASISNGRVVDLITATSAILIYGAPCSPDLNPIELMFGHYQKYLKWHEGKPWFPPHLEALDYVTLAIARSFSCHCQVPGCKIFQEAGSEKAKRSSMMMSSATHADLPYKSLQ